MSVSCHLKEFSWSKSEGSLVDLDDGSPTRNDWIGHVALGEFQEVGLQAILDSPPSLNDEFSTTLTPLIELTLSNLNTTEAILLEMKIAAEIKKDPFSQALLKLDCQGLVARITQDTVIFTAAVKLGKSWRELAEKLARLTKQQIDAYETPHHGKNGEVAPEMMWKPAYDFLYTWSAHYGDSYRDMLQDLHLALDKMKNPVTKQWREITGALILVNCMEVLRASAFSMLDEE